MRDNLNVEYITGDDAYDEFGGDGLLMRARRYAIGFVVLCCAALVGLAWLVVLS